MKYKRGGGGNKQREGGEGGGNKQREGGINLELFQQFVTTHQLHLKRWGARVVEGGGEDHIVHPLAPPLLFGGGGPH